LQIVMHASDCGVRPDETIRRVWIFRSSSVGAYMLPLSISETQYINLEEKQST
jgi:hypothetical protein